MRDFSESGMFLACLENKVVTLGDEVEVPTLNGKSKLHIVPGTQSGKILRMKAKGIPRLHNYGRGDQLVRISVWTPTKLADREKKLFRELSKCEKIHNAEHSCINN